MNCREFEDRLEALLDGTIAEGDHARCVHHAVSCANCLDLVEPMGPMLAPRAVQPPSGFRRSVLRATSGAAARVRWAATWREWVMRPRFASEAAYVGVVVLCLAGATLDRGTVKQICSEAGILLDRATSLLEKETP